MRKLLRWVVLGLLAVVAVAGVFVLYLFLRPPKMAPPSAVRVEITPARLERGKHIVEIVSDCFGCHAQRDLTRFDAPVIRGTEGSGIGPMPLKGLPGDIEVPNITPDKETGIGTWTDGEIIRAIREGVDKDGRTLFPMMPYPSYRFMSDEDVYSVVAYLRSLPPIRKQHPQTKVDFPVNLFIKSAPAPAGHVPEPNRGDKLAYGKYLATIADCEECHTQEVKGQRVAGKEFAGGRLFETPGGASVYTANITPEKDTGIGVWTEQRFIQKMRSYLPYAEGESPKVGPESFTLMPWLNLCRLSDEELSAIYAYLRTIPPVYNSVEKHKFPEATPGAGGP
ncbi:MAG TPA: cytochrome c [Bryobacterales bacterium]|nr:cytochrome c [Bryobacterales bacterium]